MSLRTIRRRCSVALLLWLGAASAAYAGAPAEAPPRFGSLVLPPHLTPDRARLVGKAVGAAEWPQTDTRYLAPAVTPALLSRPEAVSRETVAYTTVSFDSVPWGQAEWAWVSLAAPRAPLPTVLPEARQRRLIALLPPERQADTAFVKVYLDRQLARYRASQAQQLAGELTITVCTAPSSQAAQDYLVAMMADNTLPMKLLERRLASASRPTGLGAASRVVLSRDKRAATVWLTRGNLALIIRGRGTLAPEALPLAKRLDALVVRSPALTPDEFLAQRPSISLGPVTEEGRALTVEVSSPTDERIAFVQAALNGRPVLARAGTISLAGARGRVAARATVITQGLLASSAETSVTLPE